MTYDPNSPFSLPPLPPSINDNDLYSKTFVRSLTEARASLGELSGTCRAIPNPMILLNVPILQESVASSEIEGIHTTVETVLENQIIGEGVQDANAKEADRYRAALHAGFTSLESFSLSARTIKTIHQKLMPESGGIFKSHQNKIAKGAREVVYTPPEPAKTESLIKNWEDYVHDTNMDTDPLIKIAASHYQFEAIHPFHDGNGRTGRILMVLQLAHYKILPHPILYLSGYLCKNRDEYYSLLTGVTKNEDWISFIQFMINAMTEQSKITNDIIKKIVETRNNLKRKLRSEFPSNHLVILDHIFAYPVTYSNLMGEKIGVAYQTASKYLQKLESDGTLAQRKVGRKKLYYNQALLNCMRT